MFWLIFIIVSTSIWVFVDARALGANKLMRNGGSNLSPQAWALFCLLFWIVGFPMYLLKRAEYKHLNGISSNKEKWPAILGFFGALAVVGVAVLVAVSQQKIDTPTLRLEVEQSIRKTFSDDKTLSTLQIASFDLVHRDGNSYDGLLSVNDGKQYNKTIRVKVVFDGDNFMWELDQKAFQ